MKRPLTFAVTLLLAGCASKPVPDVLILPPEPPPALPVARHLAPVPPPPLPPLDPPASVARLSPSEILIAADQARADANGYVAWKRSKPENIDRLTTLTATLNIAVAQMRAGRVRGKYAPTDIIAARAALHELRSFLATKGD
jgi:hypothetical protein